MKNFLSFFTMLIITASALFGTDWTAVVCTGGFASTDTAFPIDLATNTVGTAVTVGTSPQFVAITPDGTKAYILNANDHVSPGSVSVVDLTVQPITVIATIPIGVNPNGIAITPDGTKAYVGNSTDGTLSVIDVANNVVTATIPVGSGVAGIGISPDGSKAYLIINVHAAPYVAILDVTTDLLLATTIPLVANSDPVGIAITPDGTKAIVNCTNSSICTPLDLVTNTALPSIPLDDFAYTVAISPNGTKAYLPIFLSSEVAVVDMATNTVLTTIPLPAGATPVGIAITPDGTKAYVSDGIAAHQVMYILDLALNVASTLSIPPSDSGNFGLAITPDQAPIARFTISAQGNTVTFDASASSSPTGTIASYAWNFGDGNTLTTTSPVVSHTYSTAPGAFSVTLVVTNTAGTSLLQTFTGQTVSNNGGPSAQLVQKIGSPVLPPPKFQGKLVSHPHSGTLRIHTKWDKSPSPNILKYEIFAYHKRIGTISSSHHRKHVVHLHPHHFHDKVISKKYKQKIEDKYRIRAIDSLGVASSFTQLNLTSRKVEG